MKEEATQRVIDYMNKDGREKRLEGEVLIAGNWVEASDARVTTRITHLTGSLIFEPALSDASVHNYGLMQALLGYLQEYQPVTERGFTFFPSAKFSLYSGQNHLSLHMQPDKDWSPGEVIDVFDRTKTDPAELDYVVGLLEERKTSSFVLGRVKGKEEKPPYLILRRYFRE